MQLSKIAQRGIKEAMDGYDEVTGTFVPNAFRGRIEITDRFLSNFNKPLRRRMLFTVPGTVFPASNTFRHPGTGDVYLLGQSRSDAAATGGNPYVQLTVCHLVSEGGSAGLATLYRKAPTGPAEDPGWLVEQQVTKAYVDLEFRTSASEADTFEIKVENYFAFAPKQVSVEPWDFLELHGTRYRVVDAFADSGLSAMRVDKEPDHRIDFVLHRKGGRTYNRVTHEFESADRSYNVTGVIANDQDFAAWADESQPYVDVVVESAHTGFRPQPDGLAVELDGRTRVVKHVSTQPGERQYRMRCY